MFCQIFTHISIIAEKPQKVYRQFEFGYILYPSTKREATRLSFFATVNCCLWAIPNVGRGLAPAGHFVPQNAIAAGDKRLFPFGKSENVPFSAAGASPRPTLPILK